MKIRGKCMCNTAASDNFHAKKIILNDIISIYTGRTYYTSVWCATSIVRMRICAVAILHYFAFES